MQHDAGVFPAAAEIATARNRADRRGARDGLRPRCEAVVISLPSATERRLRVSENLNDRSDVAWRFFDALTSDGMVPGLEVSEKRQLNRFGRRLSGAEIGIFKSHVSVLAAFVREKSSRWLLVLEDDVWIDPDFSLDELIDAAERLRIDYVRLFAKSYKKANVVLPLRNFRNLIRFRTDPYGAQVYIINADGASRFLNGLRSIDIPIDDELGRFWVHGLFPYCIFPFPAVERSVVSSIDAGRSDLNSRRAKYLPKLVVHRVLEKSRKTTANLKQYFVEMNRAC